MTTYINFISKFGFIVRVALLLVSPNEKKHSKICAICARSSFVTGLKNT